MRRLALALALALAITFAASMPAQETSAPDAPLAGEAGQTLALPDVTSFGGSLAVASVVRQK